jgi:hypothetical protein
MKASRLSGRAAACLLAALLLAGAVPAAANRPGGYLAAVEVRRHDPEFRITEERFAIPARGAFVEQLEVGDRIENQLLVLHPRAGAGHEFVVEQRYETSLSVPNEGPHLDLLDWKHYVSPWKALPRAGENRFITLKIDEAEASRFPPVTGDQIRAAVRREGASAEWLELVKDTKGPHGPGVWVGVSKVSFRVKVQERGRWRVVNTFHFMVPMGC